MSLKSKISDSCKSIDCIVILISALLLIYTGIRAAKLSFTFDESLSYNRFVSLRFIDIISYKVVSSNNHMINSLFLKFISIIFGKNEFLLRLPSLISHLIYLIFSFKIIRNVSSPYVALAGFLLLNLNPFFLDYFSLARGYAMAVSFTVLSIYFLFNYLENNNNNNNLFWSLIFAILAVLSNFCLLIFYVSLIASVNIYWISVNGGLKMKTLIKNNIPVLVSLLVTSVILFEPIRKLIKFKEFYDGGNAGFWTDTVGSLIFSSLYGQFYQQAAMVYIKYFIILGVFLMIITFLSRSYFVRWKIFSEKITVALLILFLTCIVSVIQHVLLKSLFLINRMALFFIPLFFIPLILVFSEYVRIAKLKLLSLSILYIACGALIFHTLSSLNISYTLMWKYDSDTKKMLSDLNIQVKKNEQAHIKLGAIWLFEPTLNFYRTTKKYDWLDEVTWDSYKNPGYDYYFLADSCSGFFKARNLTIIEHYPVSNSYLLK
jgi:uncharacterized membrane protein